MPNRQRTTVPTETNLDWFDLPCDPGSDEYAARVVSRLLQAAIEAQASDLHLTQRTNQIEVQIRVHGQLQDWGRIQDGTATKILGRLKALAKLVTYRNDVPQEGRLDLSDRNIEARFSTLPTLGGERAVIRLSTGSTKEWLLDELGIPSPILQRMQATISNRSGAVIITGPAGSGKTTTAYACLRSILKSGHRRSVLTLEDPIEAEIDGAAQSQISPSKGYDWQSGLKAILRQDPEVMLVGEIRDAETAAVVFQAAMTGQLVLTTMHARTVGDAVRRLLDMNVPTQHLRGALELLVCQRLAPQRCNCQATAATNTARENGGENQTDRCLACHGSGCSGRFLLTECLPTLERGLGRLLVEDPDTKQLQDAAVSEGMLSLKEQWRQAREANQLAPTVDQDW